MTLPTGAERSHPEPPSSRDARGPRLSRGRVALLVVVILAVLGAGAAAAALAGWFDPDETDTSSPLPSASDARPTGPAEEPTEEPTAPPAPTEEPPRADYTAQPVESWRVGHEDLAPDAPFLTLAAAAATGQPSDATVAVVVASGFEASSVIGLDSGTGAQAWRADLTVPFASCHSIGDGLVTACSADTNPEGSDPRHDVHFYDTQTGAALGSDAVDFRPWMFTAHTGSVVVAGTRPDGTLVVTRGTYDEVDARWAAASPPDTFVVGDHIGLLQSDATRIAYSVMDGGLLLDARTGNPIETSTTGSYFLWPGDYTSVYRQDATTSTFEKLDRSEPVTVEGRPWTRYSVSTPPVFGAGTSAHSTRTGELLWTAALAEPLGAYDGFTALDDVAILDRHAEDWTRRSTGFDILTGEQLWEATTPQAWSSSLHGRTILSTDATTLRALDTTTGATPWELTVQAAGGDDEDGPGYAVLGTALVVEADGEITGYAFP